MKPVPMFEGYLADEDGNIYSCWAQVSPGGSSNGFKTVLRDTPTRKMKQTLDRGYLFVGLYRDGRNIKTPVHRIIAETFVGPSPFPKAQCRHLNGIPTDNRASNLAWGTQKENTEDSRRHGTLQEGTKAYNAKLNEDLVRELRRDYGGRGLLPGEGRELARMLGIHLSIMWDAINGKTWRHVE